MGLNMQQLSASSPPPGSHQRPPDYVLQAHDLPLSVPALKEYLLDVNNMLAHHPLLVSIDAKTSEEDSADGNVSKLYEFTDQGSFLFVPTRTTYLGRVWYSSKEELGSCMIRWRAIAAAGVCIEHEMHITARAQGDAGSDLSQLKQSTWVQAPLGLGWLTTYIARRAHSTIFARLQAELRQRVQGS